MESWLTAYFSKDPVLTKELNEQLAGGPKVHALNAALIYDIDPKDAKTHKIKLQGQEKPAYDGGKRISHGFNYGMGPGHMAKTFWLTKRFAEEAHAKLTRKYEGVVQWRKDLQDLVYGKFVYKCANCGSEAEAKTPCDECSTVWRPVMRVFDRAEIEPERVLYSPFVRRRIYLGRRRDGANALASQLPQGGGNSLWMRTLLRLQGYDFYAPEIPWPTPPDAVVWLPDRMTYGDLYKPGRIFTATGTYDSFLVEAPAEEEAKVVQWVLWTVEQPWPELGGMRFPAEASVGRNWEKRDDDNPEGLLEVASAPFGNTNPYARGRR